MTPVNFRKLVRLSAVVIAVVAAMGNTFGDHGDNAPNSTSRFVSTQVQDTFIHQIKNQASNSFSYEYSLLPGEDPVKKINENAFIRVVTDKKKYYQNDIVLVTYKMYSRLVDETSIYQMPAFTGFYSFKMRQQTDDEAVEYFRNKVYRVRTLHKVLLVPFTTGTLTLSSLEVSSAVQFIQRTKQAAAKTNTLDELLDQIDEEESLPKIVQKIILKSEPVILDINPLPATRMPGFNGTVGQFTLRDSLAKQEFMVGEINKIELTLTGRGYSPVTDTPKINWPPGFTIENIESKDNYEEEGFYLNGIKKITYFFSVNKEGDYTIPPGSFLYFDPAQTAYKLLKTNTYRLHVKGRAGAIPSKHDLTRVPKEESFFSKIFLTPPITIVVITLTLVIAIAMFAFHSNKMRKVQSPSILSSNRGVDNNPELSTTFSSAKEFLAKNNYPAFLHDLQSNLISAIRDYLRISAPELSISSLSDILKEKNFNGLISFEIVALLKEIETKLYMPNQNMNDCQRLLQEAERVVAHLEKDQV